MNAVVIVRYRQSENLWGQSIMIREYVSNADTNGTGQSYSTELQFAIVFPNAQSAKAYGVCGNEHIESLLSCFK